MSVGKYPIGMAFITRRCNLDCEYCRWTGDVSKYPDRSFEEWRPYLDWLVDQSYHVNLIGGEPTIHPDFVRFIHHLAGRGASFSVATNCMTATEWNLERWQDLGLTNLSASVDVDDLCFVMDQGSREKSWWGLRSLRLAKELGYTDLHATITMTNANLPHVLELVKMLTAEGIWAEVTALSWAKGPGYDVWPQSMSGAAVRQDLDLHIICARLSHWAGCEPLAHNKEPGYFQAFAEHAPGLTWKCDRPAMVFDADCKLRLCRDIRGEAVPALNPLTMTGVEWADAWGRDVRKFCQGCFWDCHWAVCYWAGHTFIQGGKVFAHKVKEG